MHCTTHLIPISQGQTSNAQLFFSSFPASALVSRLVFSLFGSISSFGQTLYAHLPTASSKLPSFGRNETAAGAMPSVIIGSVEMSFFQDTGLCVLVLLQRNEEI